MSTQTQYAVPDWIATGDASRYQFLNWITGSCASESLLHQSVWVQYGDCVSIDKKDDGWWVYTDRILPDMTIYFQGAEDGVTSSSPEIETASSTKYLVFEEFPFRRADTEDGIHRIQNSNAATPVLTVLMDLPRRHGSTDDSPPETGINIAQNRYCEAKLPYFIARNATDVLKILNWHERLSDSWERKAAKALQTLRERIDESEYDYQFVLEDFKTGKTGILSLDSFKDICSFHSVKKHRQPFIWDNFTQETVKRFFPASCKGGLYSAVELYCEVLESSPIVTWDIPKDGMLLADDLKSSLIRCLDQQSVRKRRFTSYSEDAFRNATQLEGPDAGSIVRFQNAVTSFTEKDVFNILKERLKKRFQQLEEAIG